MAAVLAFVCLAIRTEVFAPCNRIGDPPIDIGFPPARPVYAYLDLGWEGAFGDLSIEGRAGQAGPLKDGSEANDAVRLGHSWPASRWVLLTSDRTDRTVGTLDAIRFVASRVCSVETAANRRGVRAQGPVPYRSHG